MVNPRAGGASIFSYRVFKERPTCGGCYLYDRCFPQPMDSHTEYSWPCALAMRVDTDTDDGGATSSVIDLLAHVEIEAVTAAQGYRRLHE